MEVRVNYAYKEGYLPTKRHKILRYRDVDSFLIVNIKEISLEEAPVALIVSDTGWVGDNFTNIETQYRYYDNNLYINKNEEQSLEVFYNSLYDSERNKESVEKAIINKYNKKIIIGDKLCQ